MLSCDNTGCWTVSGPDVPARKCPNFESALDIARHIPDPQTATIEVWQRGEYICCLPREEWLHGAALVRTADVAPRSAAERHANRLAGMAMATAGPCFWLALVVFALAASLGWRLLLF
jgi:hypothetical protein